MKLDCGNTDCVDCSLYGVNMSIDEWVKLHGTETTGDSDLDKAIARVAELERELAQLKIEVGNIKYALEAVNNGGVVYG